jgi:single-strand DNA-binding protein
MASLNRVELIGNVGRDPEIVYFEGGGSVAKFSIATSERWTSKSGEKQEVTQWHNVEVFGKLADVIKDYVTKGKQIYVAGQMVYDKWEDKDGNKRISAKVKVSGFDSKVILLGGKGAVPMGGIGPVNTPSPQETPQEFVVTDDDVPF